MNLDEWISSQEEIDALVNSFRELYPHKEVDYHLMTTSYQDLYYVKIEVF